MQLDSVRSLARELMDAHGLDDWSFGFDRGRRRVGCCRYAEKRITMSREFARINDLPAVKDVVLHEIAHALTPGAGHGPRFKAKARELGCTPTCTMSPQQAVSPAGRWELRCPHCDRSWQRYRRPTKTMVCGVCLNELGRRTRPLRLNALD